MSITASSLSARSAQSLSTHTATAATRNATSVPAHMAVPAQARGFSWGRYALRGLGTVIAAVLANTLFYYLGGALVAYDPDFVVLSNPGGAIIFTVVPAIVAVLLYAGLVRFTSHAASIFSVISAITFVVTLIPDFTYIPTVPGASNPQTAILVLMHVIAAAVIVRLLTSTPARQGKRV
jgi:tryptophan-rich sensory protein